MRKIILFIILISFLSCYYKPKIVDRNLAKRCQAFKTGQFVLVDSVTGVASAIIRNDTMQIENVNSSIGRKLNGEYRMTVEWINDCAYKLTPIRQEGKLVAHYNYLIVEIDSIVDDRQYYRAYPDGKRLESQTFFITKVGEIE